MINLNSVAGVWGVDLLNLFFWIMSTFQYDLVLQYGGDIRDYV